MQTAFISALSNAVYYIVVCIAYIAKPENKHDMFLVLLLGVKQNHIQIPLFDDYSSAIYAEHFAYVRNHNNIVRFLK